MSDLYSADELVDEACRETGLGDLGATAWRDGLDALLDSAASEAQLNPVGERVLRSWIHRRLVNRLRVIDWVKSHPEVRDERIEKPLIVLGLLRTGTTILCELLAKDPRNRPLMKWEGLDSLPPPERASFGCDPRIARMVEEMETTYAPVPGLKAVHFEPGDGPTECVALLTQSFRSQDWHGLFRIPSYLKWFHHCDMAPAYAYHRLSLQLLQSRAPGRWSLKAPGHMLALDALLAVYPDARLVVTHRDPLKVVPSSASLSFHSRPESLARGDMPGHFGPMWLEVSSLMVERMMDFRERRGSASFYDLQYARFVRDPIAEVARLYAHFGEGLSAEAETAMRAHLAANPRGRHGAHRYALEDFGYSREAVRERFAKYSARFDVPPEE